MIKVLHIANSDLKGGASRAAYRIHKCLVQYGDELGIDSHMRVMNKVSADARVYGARPSGVSPIREFLRPRLNLRAYKGFKLGKPTSFSIAWPDTGLGKELQQSDADIFNLHWLGNHTLSVEEIGRLQKPAVWRLADMWAFCGAEHYVTPPPAIDERFALGYTDSNRIASEKGKDLNKLTWERKMKSWKQPMHIISPTNWLAGCVKRSVLMHDWPVTVIPTAVELDRWKPMDKSKVRYVLGLPADVPLVLFGAMGGTADPRKGGDLLFEALEKLKAKVEGTPLAQLQIVVFGQDRPAKEESMSFPVHYTGHLNDDLSLSMYYAAADIMIVPSRQDNLPGTALESLACGTPVAAFDIGGLPDIVDHQQTGWLAKPFDTDDLAAGIEWVLSDAHRYQSLSAQARSIAVQKYHPHHIASQYAAVYQSVLEQSKPKK